METLSYNTSTWTMEWSGVDGSFCQYTKPIFSTNVVLDSEAIQHSD